MYTHAYYVFLQKDTEETYELLHVPVYVLGSYMERKADGVYDRTSRSYTERERWTFETSRGARGK